MPDFVKVLDKGGIDVHQVIKDGEVVSEKEHNAPSKVLLRYPVDAAEIIASDPNRFEMADEDAAADQDHLGNTIQRKAKKGAKAIAAPAKKKSGKRKAKAPAAD